MSNVISLPVRTIGDASSATHPPHVASAFLADPPPRSHAVQFYERDEFLLDTVAKFLAAGLQLGDRLIVIATSAHREQFTHRLEPFGVASAVESGQLTLLDAHETLSKFMVGDMPDPDLFRDVIARVITNGQEAPTATRTRAFGEMVDLLWRSGNSRAAIRLEELWNEAGNVHSFSLLCAYVMGNFYKEGDSQRFMDVCRTHGHVIPAEDFSQLDDADARLREISLLQQRARSLENEVRHREDLENALRDALRERSRVEEELRASVKRERLARTRAEASDAFKQVFLGILGHDLRNPLNTILMTSRMMMMRNDLHPESQKRVGRIASSGERMLRMIEQILDVTRARLASGIPITRSDACDLVPLVSKIVDEIRAANPNRVIDLRAQGSCKASVDCDRFEQVVSNLLGNAVVHGDADKPITVMVSERGTVTSLSVHNHGTPIDPSFMPLLFDPFKRSGRPQGRSDGLGLGLYISECIVSAHGGKIEVDSSAETGTRFEVILPRI